MYWLGVRLPFTRQCVNTTFHIKTFQMIDDVEKIKTGSLICIEANIYTTKEFKELPILVQVEVMRRFSEIERFNKMINSFPKYILKEEEENDKY